jgi:hypothetical protein
MNSLTVGIPVAGRLDTLKYLLRSISGQLGIDGVEVVICCWSSDDFRDIQDITSAFLPSASVMGLGRFDRFEESVAKNVLADLCRTRWLCLVNADIVLDPSALSTAMRVAGASTKEYIFSNKSKLSQEDTRKMRDNWSHKMFSKLPYSPKQQAEKVPGASTCVYGNGDFLLIERSTFLALGGYDEEFLGWGYADQDLLRRLFLAGVHQRDLTAEVKIWHQHHDYSGDWKSKRLSQLNRKRLYDAVASGVRIANDRNPWGLWGRIANGDLLHFWQAPKAP